MSGAGGKYQPLGLEQKAYIQGGAIEEKPVEMGDMAASNFFDEVSSIRDGIRAFETSVQTLSSRQVYSLSNPSPQITNQIDTLTLNLRTESSSLTSRVAALGKQVGKDEAKRGHWETLKGNLQRAVQKWQSAEQSQRQRVKERVARQFRIVKPEATEIEITQVLESSTGDQIFAQAVSSSRTEGASAALSESQARRAEMQKIEETLVELAQLFNDVAALVMTQDEQFITIEESAKSAETDMESGVGDLQKGVASAKKARKWRMWLALLAALVVIIIIVIIIIKVVPMIKKN